MGWPDAAYGGKGKDGICRSENYAAALPPPSDGARHTPHWAPLFKRRTVKNSLAAGDICD